jgi:hypothetical protein
MVLNRVTFGQLPTNQPTQDTPSDRPSYLPPNPIRPHAAKPTDMWTTHGWSRPPNPPRLIPVGGELLI